MDFSWSTEQFNKKQSVVNFANNDLSQNFIERDQKG